MKIVRIFVRNPVNIFEASFFAKMFVLFYISVPIFLKLYCYFLPSFKIQVIDFSLSQKIFTKIRMEGAKSKIFSFNSTHNCSNVQMEAAV
jgi:hypothetical protein